MKILPVCRSVEVVYFGMCVGGIFSVCFFYDSEIKVYKNAVKSSL